MLVVEVGSKFVMFCDVIDYVSLDDVFLKLKLDFGIFDFVFYVIVFFDCVELKGRYVDISVDNFFNSLNILCYFFMVIV